MLFRSTRTTSNATAATIGVASVVLDGVTRPGAGEAAAIDGAGVATSARDASGDDDGTTDAVVAGGALGLATAGAAIGAGAWVAVGLAVAAGLAVGRTVGFGVDVAVGRMVGLGVAVADSTTIVPNICSGCTWQ